MTDLKGCSKDVIYYANKGLPFGFARERDSQRMHLDAIKDY